MKKIIKNAIYTALGALMVMAATQNLHAQKKPTNIKLDTTKKKNVGAVRYNQSYDAKYYYFKDTKGNTTGGVIGSIDGGGIYTKDDSKQIYFSIGGHEPSNVYFTINKGHTTNPTLYAPQAIGAKIISKGILAFFAGDKGLNNYVDLPHIFINSSGQVGIGANSFPSDCKFKVIGKSLFEGNLSVEGNLTTSNIVIGQQGQSSLTVNGNSTLNGDLSVSNLLTTKNFTSTGNASFHAFSVDGLFTTNSLSATGNASFNANLSVANLLTTKDFNITGNASFNSLSMSGALTATGGLTVGSATKNSTLSVYGNSLMQGNLISKGLEVEGNVNFGDSHNPSVVQLNGELEISNGSSQTRIPDSNGNIYLSSPQLYITDNTNTVKLQFDNEKGKVSIGSGGFTVIAPALIDKYNLFVTKGILSEDYMIGPKTTWADNVFKPGYRVTDLKELETYIKKYNHLPNIPSAGQIGSKGYSLHDMNVKFLEKMEELTLHQIEQEKQNSLQQTEINSLKAQVESYKQLAAEVKTLRSLLLRDKRDKNN